MCGGGEVKNTKYSHKKYTDKIPASSSVMLWIRQRFVFKGQTFARDLVTVKFNPSDSFGPSG